MLFSLCNNCNQKCNSEVGLKVHQTKAAKFGCKPIPIPDGNPPVEKSRRGCLYLKETKEICVEFVKNRPRGESYAKAVRDVRIRSKIPDRTIRKFVNEDKKKWIFGL